MNVTGHRSLVDTVVLVAQCQTFSQVILCQGVAAGARAPVQKQTNEILAFNSSLACSSQVPLKMCLVVLKKRSQAFGVLSLAIGSGVGGTVLPIITQKPFWKVIITLAVIVAKLFLCPRLPPSNVKGGLFDWHAIENPAFACCGNKTTLSFSQFI